MKLRRAARHSPVTVQKRPRRSEDGFKYRVGRALRGRTTTADMDDHEADGVEPPVAKPARELPVDTLGVGAGYATVRARSSLVPRRRRRRQPEPIAHPALPTLALTAPASPHPRLIAGEHAARDPSHEPRARARRGRRRRAHDERRPTRPAATHADAPASLSCRRRCRRRGRLRRRRRRRGHPTSLKPPEPRTEPRTPSRQTSTCPRASTSPPALPSSSRREPPFETRLSARPLNPRRTPPTLPPPTPSRSPRNRRRRSPRNRRRRRTRPRPPSRISRRRRPRTRVRRRIRRPSPTHRRRNPRNLPRRPRRRRTFCAKTAGTSPR